MAASIARRITKRLPLSHLTATIMAPHVSKLSTFRNGSHIHDLATKSPKFNWITAPNLFFSLRNFSSQIPPDDNDDEDIKHLNRRQMEGLIDDDDEDRHLTPLQKETLDEMIEVVKNRRSADIRSAVHGVVALGSTLTLVQLRPWYVELLPPPMYDIAILLGAGLGVYQIFSAVTSRKTQIPLMSLFKEMEHDSLLLTHLLEGMKCCNKEDASLRQARLYTLYLGCFLLVVMRVTLYLK